MERVGNYPILFENIKKRKKINFFKKRVYRTNRILYNRIARGNKTKTLKNQKILRGGIRMEKHKLISEFAVFYHKMNAQLEESETNWKEVEEAAKEMARIARELQKLNK